MREVRGGVYQAWSKGSKVDASSLGSKEEEAVLKAFVDWFSLHRASMIVYTYGSSFGKTAAEASDAPNLDVNHTSCLAAEADGRDWSNDLPERGADVSYDTSRVPGAANFKPVKPLVPSKGKIEL